MIYIVEDDASIRELEQYALQTNQYTVRGFEDGASFWAAVRETVPDLVILDVMLPDEDGYQILGRLRETAATRTGVASGTALTFEQTASAAGFQKILNGNHTITVEGSDGKETVSTSATFTKAVHAASVTLAEPLAVEGDITVAVLQVTGSIPDDAKFKAEVTNNALDSSPVWQDATTEVKKGVNIVFENKTATNGAAFNFRVSVERGESGEGGYIEAVSGAFQ